MTSSVSSHHLLMNKVQTPHDDQGIMDLGKNCHQCHDLDFLPFHCEFCNHTYCSKHRSAELHNCVGRPQRQGAGQVYAGPTAASLFPDREKRRQQLEKLLKEASPTPTTIAQKVVGKSSPLMKLTKYLHIQRTKRKSFLSRSKSPNPVVEVASIKKVAKGAAKVPVTDRVYLWVLHIKRSDDELDKISFEAERKGVWVLKKWSAGRALDSIADTLGIININNSTQQSAERLSLFKVEREAPVLLGTSKKVGEALSNGATVYLVRGSMEQ